MANPATPITIAHVLFRFAIGGLENGVVNLINRLPEEDYYHHIICLTDYDEAFFERIKTTNVSIHCLHKKQGKDLGVWWRLYRLLRSIKPVILHSRNFSAIESHTPALLAGVPFRVHGEHGWDVNDLHGSNEKYRIARRVFSYLIGDFIALSRDLEHYLLRRVGVPARKIHQIYNGVDSNKFHPVVTEQGKEKPAIVIGTVGRMKAIKHQTLLVDAFIAIHEARPELKGKLSLHLIGDGPLREDCLQRLTTAGLENQAWLPGDRSDVPELMREFDIFVLPSLGEGISNTILEAMACQLPVVATDVGGNAELVAENETGTIVPSDDVAAMISALQTYIDEPELRIRHGVQGRERVLASFSMESMVAAYDAIYRQAFRLN